MILKILFVACVAIFGILVFAATKPDTFRIQRSIAINAPPERVFELIDDFHQWPRWAPQDREDTTMRRSYGLQSSGVGAVSQWKSDGSAGASEMAITAAIPHSRIDVTADWIKPFKVRNTHEFEITPEGTAPTGYMEGGRLKPLHDEDHGGLCRGKWIHGETFRYRIEKLEGCR